MEAHLFKLTELNGNQFEPIKAEPVRQLWHCRYPKPPLTRRSLFALGTQSVIITPSTLNFAIMVSESVNSE